MNSIGPISYCIGLAISSLFQPQVTLELITNIIQYIPMGLNKLILAFLSIYTIQLIGIIHLAVAYAYYKKKGYVINLCSFTYVCLLIFMIIGLILNRQLLWGEQFSKGLEKVSLVGIVCFLVYEEQGLPLFNKKTNKIEKDEPKKEEQVKQEKKEKKNKKKE